MARVQSILTYTLPACVGDTQPLPAPIRCGCDKFLLILDDRSLILTALRGILSVDIISVAVSAAPVSSIDSSTGQSALVWKYDYTIEYQDTDLTDPLYRIRKCDILYNCCYGCGHAYTDRQLEGYVQSVTGDGVNNADPQNPVITEVPLAVTDSNSIDLTSSGSFGHTLRADAIISPIAGNALLSTPNGLYTPAGIASISSTQGCEGIGAAYAVKNASIVGTVLTLNGAAEHFSIGAAGVGVSEGPNLGQGVGPNIDYVTQITGVTIVNPSACRPLQVALVTEMSIEFETPGIPFRYNWALQAQFNGIGGFNDIQARNSYTPNSSVLVSNRDENFTTRQTVITIAPGGTLIMEVRGRFRPIGTAAIIQSYTLGISAIGSTS